MTSMCTCDEWKESMPQIDSAQFLAYSHGQPYTGKKFQYCPWCGEKLFTRELP